VSARRRQAAAGEPAVEAEGPDRVIRSSRPQQVLVAELERADAFRSAADLHLRLREAGHRIGLSTVYRRLHELVAGGQVDCVRGDGGERKFRLRRTRVHTHYLFCRRCGAAVEIGDDTVEKWLEELGAARGYRAVRHELALSGVCEDCLWKRGDEAADDGGCAGRGRRRVPLDPGDD
jgi:Fur family ferric uptake transcriptional regulator